MSVIQSREFIEALQESGVVPKGEIHRVVVEAGSEDGVLIFIQRYGDTRLIEAIPALAGVEVHDEGGRIPVVADDAA